MVKETQRFAELSARNKGIRVIRKWANAEEVFTPVASSESKGVGFYRVAFSVGDIVQGEKADVRFGRTERDFASKMLGAFVNILRRLFY